MDEDLFRQLKASVREMMAVERGEKKPSHVFIVKKCKPNMKRAVAALRKLQALGGLQCFGDVVKWQREQRKDRPLPGRE